MYFDNVVLSQPLNVSSEQVPVDGNVLMESLEANKKHYEVPKEYVNKGLIFLLLLTGFTKIDFIY